MTIELVPLDVRGVMETDDGALISATYNGRIDTLSYDVYEVR